MTPKSMYIFSIIFLISAFISSDIYNRKKEKIIEGLMNQIGCEHIYEDYTCGNY